MARVLRRTSEERRQEIVEATLRVMASEGIHGATTAKIAAAAGVSEGTLYRLFGSKQKLMVAAVDAVYAHFREVVAVSDRPDALGRLREIVSRHSACLVDSKRERYVGPLFDFISAPRSAGLTDEVASRQQWVLDMLAGLVEEGKAEGSVPEDCDAYLIAWMLVCVFWAEDICTLIGLPGFLLEGRSAAMVEGLFRCFVTEPHS